MIRIQVSEKRGKELGIVPSEFNHYFEVSYQGCVLDTYSESLGFGDFASYAVAWDANEKRIVAVNYAYNGLGGTDDNSADVDCTPENRAVALAYALPRITQRIEDEVEGDFYHEAHKIWSGKRVKVVKGRKFPIGAEGTVKWSGETRFGFSTLVAWDDGSEGWLATHNLEISNPPEYIRDQAIIDRKVAAAAKCFWNYR